MAEHSDFDRFYQSKWEQLKNATRLAADHRQRVKEGDLSVFLIPLVLALSKDFIFDIIPVIGLLFGFFITVYLFIFMWGRGRLLLRFIFFIVAVLGLVPIIKLIPFETASVIFAFYLAKRDADKAKADLEKLDQALPKIAQGLKGAAIQRDRMLRAQAAAQAEAVDVQEQSQGNVAEEAGNRTNQVPLAREVPGFSAAELARRTARPGSFQPTSPNLQPAGVSQSGSSEAPPSRLMDGAQGQLAHMRGRAANDSEYRARKSMPQQAVSGSDIAPASQLRQAGIPPSFAGVSHMAATSAPAMSVGPSLVTRTPFHSAQSASTPKVPVGSQNTSYQSAPNQSGDAMMRIRAAGSQLSQSTNASVAAASLPLAGMSQMPLPPVVPHIEPPKTSTVDPALFKQESRTYIDALATIYSRKPSDILRLKTIHADFFRPYQTGQRSLGDLLRNNETASQTLELLRKANTSYHYQVDDTTWKKRAPDFNSLPEFLSHEIATSLDALDVQLQRDDLSEHEMRQLRNNAFYVVAEALDTASVDGRKKIDAWLEKHEEDIKALDTFTYNDGNDEDTLAHLTKQKIIVNTENDDMARRHLEALFAGPFTEESGDKLDEIRRGTIDPILERFDPEDSVLVQRQALVAEVEAASFGLDKKIIEKWQAAKIWHKKDEQGNDIYRESYRTNLEAVRKLEIAQPGAAATLYKEFGIADFGRYDKKILLRQLEMKDEDVRYGVAVYPEADWNGAFFQNAEQLVQVSEQLQSSGVETRIVEAESQRDLARRLLMLHKKDSARGKKFAFAIVAGHGSENSVALGQTKAVIPDPPPLPDSLKTDEQLSSAYDKWLKSLPNQDKGDFTKEDILGGKGIGRALSEWFEDGAPKVLISCSTGAEGGIAQHASAKSSGQISAPKIPTNVEKIDVIFDKEGKFSFDVKYHKSDTAQYTAGEKVMNRDV